MVISAKARLVSLIVALVFMAGTLIGSGTYLIINHINNANATTETTLSVSGNLYNTNGTINTSAVTDFLNKLDFVTSGGTYTSPQIADNARVTATNSFIFNMGYYVSPSGAMTTSKPITWQAVYARNGYLTIWMIQNYTVSDYNDSGVDVSTSSPFSDYSGNAPYADRHNYSQSVIRDATSNIYDLISAQLDKFDTIIATPTSANQASNWQSSQSNAGYSVMNGLGSNTGTTNPYDLSFSSCMSDKFWIPSYYEAFYDGTSTGNYTFDGGLWGLSATDVSFSTTRLDTSTTSYCWLRSGSL